MAKVHKSFRFDEELAAAIATLAADGESEASTYSRVLAAGVAALMGERASRGEQDKEADRESAALIAALESHIETLKADKAEMAAQVAIKDEQMAVKDEQIRALSVLTAQAQELHGASVTKAIDQPARETETTDGNQGEAQSAEQRRGFWARIFG